MSVENLSGFGQAIIIVSEAKQGQAGAAVCWDLNKVLNSNFIFPFKFNYVPIYYLVWCWKTDSNFILIIGLFCFGIIF